MSDAPSNLVSAITAGALACVSFFASVIRLHYISHFKERKEMQHMRVLPLLRGSYYFLVSASKVQRTAHSSVGTTAIQARVLLNVEKSYQKNKDIQ